MHSSELNFAVAIFGLLAHISLSLLLCSFPLEGTAGGILYPWPSRKTGKRVEVVPLVTVLRRRLSELINRRTRTTRATVTAATTGRPSDPGRAASRGRAPCQGRAPQRGHA